MNCVNKKNIFSLLTIVLVVFVITTLVVPEDVFARAQPGGTVSRPSQRPANPTVSTGKGVPAVLASGGLAALKTIGWGIVIIGTLKLLHTVLSYLLLAASYLLDVAFNLSINPVWFTNDAIIRGWEIMRDFVNIWLIFFLLVIAIATILRVESYSAKRTLGTLIIFAVLINFSLPITKVILDASNVLAYQFLKKVGVNKENGKAYIVSENISKSLRLQELAVDETTENEIGESLNTQLSQNYAPTSERKIGVVQEANAEGLIGGTLSDIGCGASLIAPDLTISKVVAIVACSDSVAGLAYNYFFGNKASASESSTLGLVSVRGFVKLIFSILLLAVAVYVMFAIAIMIIIRIIVLMFLVVLSPLAFGAAAMPGTAQYSKTWWDTLAKQAIFVPAILFLLWVAMNLAMGAQGALSSVSGPKGHLTDAVTTQFFLFVFFVCMFYACLLLARKMGAYGADTAIKWFGTGKSLLTGAVVGGVGGLALRNTVGRLGTFLQQKEGVQKSYYGRQFADWMATRKTKWVAPISEVEKDKAAFVMKQPESERAKGFAGLGRSGKEFMLKQMSAEERSRLADRLSPEQRKIAEQIMGTRFSAKERSEQEFEGWKRLPEAEQKSRFGTFDPATQEKILRSYDDEKRAKYMSGLSASDQSVAQTIIDQKFNTAEKPKHTEGAQKYALRKEQDAGTLDTYLKGLSDDDLKEALRLMNRDQLQTALETGVADPVFMDKIVKQKARLGFEDQERIDQALGRSTDEIVTAYLKATEAVGLTDQYNKAFKNLGSAQLVKQWEKAFGKGTVALTAFQNKINTLLSATDVDNYQRAFLPYLQKQNVNYIAQKYRQLPDQVRTEMADRDPNRVKAIYYADRTLLTKIIDDIKASGSGEKYVLPGSPDRMHWAGLLGITLPPTTPPSTP